MIVGILINGMIFLILRPIIEKYSYIVSTIIYALLSILGLSITGATLIIGTELSFLGQFIFYFLVGLVLIKILKRIDYSGNFIKFIILGIIIQPIIQL